MARAFGPSDPKVPLRDAKGAPSAGLELPADCTAGLVSADLARYDADWFVDRLYGFADDAGSFRSKAVGL